MKQPRFQVLFVLAAGALLGFAAASSIPIGQSLRDRLQAEAKDTVHPVRFTAHGQFPNPTTAAKVPGRAADNTMTKDQALNTKPNVVFILADNVGYGDLGPYGGGELRGAPTPRIDQLAREGLRLSQYLVEPGCTPSRAALMTGQYSIRNGLSLILIPGSPNTLSKNASTMGQLFKLLGYFTAIFGKWHLGAEPGSLPTAHGFDEFYGIPPDISWDSCTYVDTMLLMHSTKMTRQQMLAKGTQIVEAVAGGPLRTVKPFTREVRSEIDTELVEKSIDFMRRAKAAGKPFFLYLPFSMGRIFRLSSSPVSRGLASTVTS